MVLAAERGFSFADPAAVAILFGGLALFAATVALTKEPERSFTAAIVYLVLGAAGALLLDIVGSGLLDPLEDAKTIEHLAEFAVIVALFSAGLRLDRSLTWANWRSVAVLLGIVMPVTIAAITLFAHEVMGLTLGAAVLLAAVLAPTDPVLAGDLQVGPPGDEHEPEPRFALTAEAGLNDGLAFPFVYLGLFIAAEGGTDWVAEWVLADIVYAICAGVVLGFAGGRLAAQVSLRLRSAGFMEERFDGWLAIATVLAVYGLTEVAGAYGFVAAFTAGLAFRRYERDHTYHGRVHAGAETVEHVGELAIVLLLGSTLTLDGLGQIGVEGWLLVVLLLVVIRPLATLAGFVRLPVPWRERLFIGWFGIRGVGSFYYVAVVLGTGVLATSEAATLYWTVFACVGVSIVLHGVSSRPAVKGLGLDRAT